MQQITRVYEVIDTEAPEDDPVKRSRLVDARSGAASIAHCSNKGKYVASVPNQKRVAKLMSMGVKLEEAHPEPEPEDTNPK